MAKKPLATAVAAAAAIQTMTAEEALAEVQNFGVFGSIVGGAVGSFFGGPIGGVAGSMIGDFAASQFTTANIGSSTPIQAAGGGGGLFPNTFGTTATQFGTTATPMINAFKRHGSFPSKRGTWGNPSSNTNMKVFGSGGLIDALRGKEKPMRGFFDAYTNSISTNDRRAIFLFVNKFITSSGAATSGGGVPDSGTGDCAAFATTFYANLRSATGLASGREAAMQAVCRAGGFRSIPIWGRTIHHTSSESLPDNLKPNTLGELGICADGCALTASFTGASLNAIARGRARRAKTQNVMFHMMIPLVLKAAQLLIRNGHRLSAALRFLRDEGRRLGFGELSDAFLRIFFDNALLGVGLLPEERRNLGRNMVEAMRHPHTSNLAIVAANRPAAIVVHPSIETALDNLNANVDVYRELLEFYLDWARLDDEETSLITWNSSSKTITRIN